MSWADDDISNQVLSEFCEALDRIDRAALRASSYGKLRKITPAISVKWADLSPSAKANNIQRNREWRAKNPEIVRDLRKKQRQANIEKVRAYDAERAKRKRLATRSKTTW